MIESFAFCVRHIQDFFFFSCRLAGANLLITFGLNFRWFNWTTFELFSRYEVTHTSFIPPEWQRERLSSHFGLGSTSARLCLLFSDQHLRSASIPQLHSEACRGKAGVVFMADQANQALFFSSSPHRLSENESGCQMKALSRAALGRTKINK